MEEETMLDFGNRIFLTLTTKTNKRLNAYCLKIAKRNGEIPRRLKQKIMRAAMKEWLDNHENDITIKFEE